MMNELAISVRDLSKAYSIARGRVGGARQTFGELIVDRLRHPLRRTSAETFWALKDVSFDVRKGEVVGIVGRNGAGKSTLLKVLSRIAEPTTGRIKLFGRVGSLLEVGTGFHPELTGRENIYLNGAVLGMTRAEIRGRFDEIVAFAEVERFLDTPVKRYSSGMYVRLAFAVAAHLEPEILVVDEVLAVGDAEFQRKCLGKMRDVASGGRTVLFVSHNLQAVQSLCSRAVLLHGRTIHASGSPDELIARYMALGSEAGGERVWSPEDRPGDATCRLCALRVTDPAGIVRQELGSRDAVHVEMEFDLTTVPSGFCAGFDLVSMQGDLILRAYQTDLPEAQTPQLKPGRNRLLCVIPPGLLNGGTYGVCPRISVHNQYWIVHSDPEITFDLTLNHGVSPYWNALDAKARPGVIAPIFQWSAR